MSDPRPGISGIANNAIDALKNSPVLMLVILLNVVFVISFGYYLMKAEQHQAEYRQSALLIMEKCILQTTPIPKN